MSNRPSMTESEKDLLKQNKEFQKNVKRKQNEFNSTATSSMGSQKSKSRFAKHKKERKESVINYTHIQEIEANKELKDQVLGEIVENPEALISQPEFVPPPSTVYKPPKMTAEQMELFEQQQELPENEGKTIYQLHMEYLGMWKVPPKKQEKPVQKKKTLKTLDAQGSYLPESLQELENCGSIHSENMELISSWSHEKRMEEASELLTKLKPQFIQTLQNRRKNKSTPKEDRISESLSKDVSQMDIDPHRNVPDALKGQWVHMDKVEKQKMKWMSDLPPVKPLKGNEGFIARFNFKGELLPYDAQISVTEGLHHHGEEPGRAGYSIDEVFLLTRSRVSQQRHIGLKILGNILQNSKMGLFDGCFDTPLLQLLVDAGVVVLLRLAVDENTAQVYTEALNALYHLVCSDPDEQCLHLLEAWSPHHVVPSITSKIHHKEKDRKELDEEQSTLSDTEIIKLDLIRALSRMDILPRFRYFIETVKPSPTALSRIFGILIRMVRHSLSVAWDIANCPNLLSSIVKHFVPSDIRDGVPMETLTSAYGLPFKPALTFFMVLSQRGRELANKISNIPGLTDALAVYMTMDQNRTCLPVGHSLALTVESYSLLSSLLSYGHKKPQETFRTVFPLLMKQLHFYREQVDVTGPANTHDIGTQMIRLMTVGLLVSSTESLLTARMNSNQPSRESYGKPEVLVPPILRWKEIEDSYPVIETCLNKWIFQLQGHDVQIPGYRIVGAACRFIEVFIENWINQNTFDVSKAMQRTNFIQDKVVAPYLTSDKFKENIGTISQYSMLSSKLDTGVSRDPVNLDSLGSVSHAGKVVPIFREKSLFPFLYPFSSLISTLLLSNPSLKESWTDLRIREAFVPYVTKIIESPMKLASNWFTRIELHTFVNFARTVAIVDSIDENLYTASLKVLPHVQKHDEHLIKTLLVEVVGTVSMGTGNSLQSCNLLFKNLMDDVTLKSSFLLQRSVPFLLNTFTVDFHEGLRPLDGYWPLKPFLNEDITRETVITCLQFCLTVLQKLPLGSSQTNRNGWYSQISRIFLNNADLFHDNEVSLYLEKCLKEILKNGKLAPDAKGLTTSVDWYKQLVEEFDSRSYGNRIFTLYILVPLVMSWPVDFRQVFWSDHSVTLSFIAITCDDMGILPLEDFLEPKETDESLLFAYKRYLSSPQGRSCKSSFLHRIASHHVSE